MFIGNSLNLTNITWKSGCMNKWYTTIRKWGILTYKFVIFKFNFKRIWWKDVTNDIWILIELQLIFVNIFISGVCEMHLCWWFLEININFYVQIEDISLANIWLNLLSILNQFLSILIIFKHFIFTNVHFMTLCFNKVLILKHSVFL